MYGIVVCIFLVAKLGMLLICQLSSRFLRYSSVEVEPSSIYISKFPYTYILAVATAYLKLETL